MAITSKLLAGAAELKQLLAALALLLCVQAQAACVPNSGEWTVNATSAVFKICPADGSDYVTIGNSAAQAGGSLPSGMIAAFNAACPAGWTELTAARGRVIVGVPASGTLAATVGTALTDAQDKSVAPTFTGTPFSDVINHTHPVTDPGHSHTQASTTTSTGSASNRLGTADTSSTAQNTGTATTGVTTNNPAGGVASITPAGTVSAVTTSGVIAYLQLRFCTKD